MKIVHMGLIWDFFLIFSIPVLQTINDTVCSKPWDQIVNFKGLSGTTLNKTFGSVEHYITNRLSLYV